MEQSLPGMPVRMSARNADLNDLAILLREQHVRKLDMVVPASKIRSESGVLVLEGTEAEIDDDGVTATEGRYRPTAICDEGISDKLGIPVQYLRRMRQERADLYDANVNGWLHGRIDPGIDADEFGDADGRSFLLRCFTGAEPGSEGVARAFLSQSYKMIDNLDVLTAALDGVRETGMHVDIDGCDLTERRMYVRIVSPEVKALAPVLLRNYRSPFDDPSVQRAGGWDIESGRRAAAREGMGYEPGKEPVIFAGFVISNSETGGGAFSLTPRLVVEICKNGLTITADALRNVHLGGKMEEGIVRWSDDTQRKSLELVTAQARDAVATFLDVDYVTRVVTRLEEKAGEKVSRPQETIETIGKTLRFSQEATAGVLDHFIRGGDVTAGGVMQAVTSFAQTIDDADAAFDMEAQALRALDLAAAG